MTERRVVGKRARGPPMSVSSSMRVATPMVRARLRAQKPPRSLRGREPAVEAHLQARARRLAEARVNAHERSARALQRDRELLDARVHAPVEGLAPVPAPAEHLELL